MGDEIAGLDHRLLMWGLPRQQVKLRKGNGACSVGPRDMDDGLDRGHGHAHV